MSLECGAAGAAMDEYVDDSTTCKPVDSINLGVGTPAHSDSAVRPTTQTLARADRLALALFRRQLATGLLLQRHVVPGEVRTQACVLYCTPDFTYLWWFESVLVGKKKGIALADIVEVGQGAAPTGARLRDMLSHSRRALDGARPDEPVGTAIDVDVVVDEREARELYVLTRAGEVLHLAAFSDDQARHVVRGFRLGAAMTAARTHVLRASNGGGSL